jgi:hypothetical protein
VPLAVAFSSLVVIPEGDLLLLLLLPLLLLFLSRRPPLTAMIRRS